VNGREVHVAANLFAWVQLAERAISHGVRERSPFLVRCAHRIARSRVALRRWDHRPYRCRPTRLLMARLPGYGAGETGPILLALLPIKKKLIPLTRTPPPFHAHGQYTRPHCKADDVVETAIVPEKNASPDRR